MAAALPIAVAGSHDEARFQNFRALTRSQTSRCHVWPNLVSAIQHGHVNLQAVTLGKGSLGKGGLARAETDLNMVGPLTLVGFNPTAIGGFQCQQPQLVNFPVAQLMLEGRRRNCRHLSIAAIKEAISIVAKLQKLSETA
jgi:hypothetical protein